MALPPKPLKSDGLNRHAWFAQTALKEVETWRRWVDDSADKFLADLAIIAARKGMPVEDVANLRSICAQLGELKKNLRPLEKAVHAATGQRIAKARKQASR
ncbi:MAG: hypothetical protein H0U59_12885 [Gemmatimonadaceae bacterium]|nr:hypothetical protein [Gemmatimonadaceae bacterium]